MKKGLAVLCVSLSIVLFVSGCSVSRGVQENTFRSSYPKLAVRVSPEFTYLGNTKTFEYHPVLGNRSSVDRLRNEVDTYRFVRAAAKDAAARGGIIIGFKETEHDARYIGSRYKSPENLDYGTVKFAGEEYEYVVRLSRLGKSERSPLAEAGYKAPKCVLVKEYTRIEYKNSYRFIRYWEDAPALGGACTKGEKGALPDEGLAAFNRRAIGAFTVLSETGK